MQTINYAAFGKLGKVRLPAGLKLTPLAIVQIILMFGLFVVLLVVLIIFALMFPVIAAVGWLLLFLWLVLRPQKSNKSFEKKLLQFAAANSWSTGGKAPVPPAMLKLHYRSDQAIVSGKLEGQNFWLYNCYPGKGSDKNALSVVFLSIELPQNLPSLLLVPGSGVMGLAFDEIARSDFGLQPITLEGDFNKHVRAYSEAGQQVSTLEYLTPDVMDVLKNSVEAIVLYSGNYLSVSVQELNDGATVKLLFDDAQALTKELKQKMSIL